MNGQTLVKLAEEMIDLKLQQHAQANLKASPEIARILEEKRVTDLAQVGANSSRTREVAWWVTECGLGAGETKVLTGLSLESFQGRHSV